MVKAAFELCSLNGWILWYVNYISRELILKYKAKKEDREVKESQRTLVGFEGREKCKKRGWLLEAENDPWLTTIKEMTNSVIKLYWTQFYQHLSMPRGRFSPWPPEKSPDQKTSYLWSLESLHRAPAELARSSDLQNFRCCFKLLSLW